MDDFLTIFLPLAVVGNWWDLSFGVNWAEDMPPQYLGWPWDSGRGGNGSRLFS